MLGVVKAAIVWSGTWGIGDLAPINLVMTLSELYTNGRKYALLRQITEGQQLLSVMSAASFRIVFLDSSVATFRTIVNFSWRSNLLPRSHIPSQSSLGHLSVCCGCSSLISCFDWLDCLFNKYVFGVRRGVVEGTSADGHGSHGHGSLLPVLLHFLHLRLLRCPENLDFLRFS